MVMPPMSTDDITPVVSDAPTMSDSDRAGPNCSGLHETAQSCSELLLGAACSELPARSCCSELLRTVQNCSELLRTAARSCSELLRTVQNCSELLRSAQNCSELFRAAQNCSELLRTAHTDQRCEQTRRGLRTVGPAD